MSGSNSSKVAANNERPASEYMGVSWNKAAMKWLAQIKLNHKTLYLGLYVNQGDAAKIYEVARAAIDIIEGKPPTIDNLPKKYIDAAREWIQTGNSELWKTVTNECAQQDFGLKEVPFKLRRHSTSSYPNETPPITVASSAASSVTSSGAASPELLVDFDLTQLDTFHGKLSVASIVDSTHAIGDSVGSSAAAPEKSPYEPELEDLLDPVDPKLREGIEAGPDRTIIFSIIPPIHPSLPDPDPTTLPSSSSSSSRAGNSRKRVRS